MDGMTSRRPESGAGGQDSLEEQGQVERQRVHEQRGDKVGEDEVGARRREEDLQGHNGLGRPFLNPDEEGERQGEDDEGGDDEWMLPGQDVSAEVDAQDQECDAAGEQKGALEIKVLELLPSGALAILLKPQICRDSERGDCGDKGKERQLDAEFPSPTQGLG